MKIREQDSVARLLEDVLEDVEPSPERFGAEVALCTADEHPVFAGRVKCSFERATGPRYEAWLPCLNTVRPRPGDRVLVVHPAGMSEGLVTGVLDGFRRRIQPDPRAAHTRRLRQDEVVRIERDDGEPLVEVRSTESGTAIRLLDKNVTLDAAGELRLEGESVAIVARQGAVEVKATDDVKLNGEQIHLN